MDHYGVASFAHTLQLTMSEALLSWHGISDAPAISKRFVGHFKHLPLAYSRSYDIQVELNMPPKCLQQDVYMRLNNTYYMTESLIAQKWALCAYTMDLPATWTAN